MATKDTTDELVRRALNDPIALEEPAPWEEIARRVGFQPAPQRRTSRRQRWITGGVAFACAGALAATATGAAVLILHVTDTPRVKPADQHLIDAFSRWDAALQKDQNRGNDLTPADNQLRNYDPRPRLQLIRDARAARKALVRTRPVTRRGRKIKYYGIAMCDAWATAAQAELQWIAAHKRHDRDAEQQAFLMYDSMHLAAAGYEEIVTSAIASYYY